jgi:hypothetical protein
MERTYVGIKTDASNPIFQSRNVFGIRLLERLRAFKKTDQKLKRIIKEQRLPKRSKARRNSCKVMKDDAHSSIEVHLPSLEGKQGRDEPIAFTDEKFETRKEALRRDSGQGAPLNRIDKRSHSQVLRRCPPLMKFKRDKFQNEDSECSDTSSEDDQLCGAVVCRGVTEVVKPG